MERSELEQLRSLVGKYTHMVYEAVKAGKVSELSHDEQLQAKAIQEHLHLPGVHNALEFADVREGQPFEMEVRGQPLSPLAHIAQHAAVLSMLEGDNDAKAAFETLTKEEGASEHHAIHMLSGLSLGFLWVSCHGQHGLERDESDLLRGDLGYALKRICRDPRYRRRLAQEFSASHWEQIDNQ